MDEPESTLDIIAKSLRSTHPLDDRIRTDSPLDSDRIRPDSPMTWGELFGSPRPKVPLESENSGDNSLMSDQAESIQCDRTLVDSLQSAPAEIVWSEQQQAIYDHVDNPNAPKHCIVIAVAGAGKTTTLIECFKRIVKSGRKVLFLAFNKEIETEIKKRLMNLGFGSRVKVSTFHAHGFGLWMNANRGCKKDGPDVERGQAGYYKFDRILEELNQEGLGEIPYMYRSFANKAWTFARQSLFGFKYNLMDKSKWLELVDHYDLEDEIADVAEEDGIILQGAELQDHVFKAINWTVHILRKGIRIAHEVIDFEDMLYMPLVANIHVWQQDWVLVDESQDTNASNRAYVAKILKPSGRSVWVGDPAQAIYGFRGADAQSIDLIKHQFGAIELPLTITYRCPKEVVELARQWVSHITAAETAPQGDGKRIINQSDLLKENLSPQDVILCRNNKPLMDLALALIRRGIACHVRGRKIGEKLVKMVTKWKSVETLDELTLKLEWYRDREIQKAMAKGKEQKAETVSDECDTLLALISDMPRGSSLNQLEWKIRDMFVDKNDNDRPTLTLSSIHKAKGLEWNRVFWYGYNVYNPSKYARQDWQQEQERNLMYVAVTRSKHALVRVNVPYGPVPIRFEKEVA